MRQSSPRDAAGITTTIRPLGVVNGRTVWPIAGGTDLELLERRHLDIQQQIDTILARSDGRDGRVLASENRQIEGLIQQRTIVAGQIAQVRDRDERRAAGARVQQLNGSDPSGQRRLGGGFGAGADTVYARGNGHSYFADIIATATPGNPAAWEAQQRLADHAQVIERAADDLPREFRASPLKRAAGTKAETRVNPNRTDGQGGWFVPPLYLIDEYVAMLRAGRAAADRCQVEDLPPGTDSINLPKIATGTTTAIQAADAGAVSSTDFTDAVVTGPVRTIAGQQDVAQQLLDQSPVNLDQILFADLIADYNMKFDVQVLAGSGAAGQCAGIFNVAGANVLSYTDASPTLPELYLPLTQGMSQVARLRFKTPDTILMHPSRWYWMVAALDAQQRPLVTPTGNSMNSIAVYDAEAAEGVAGAIGNVPIVVDANVPTNAGAGTNQDRIIIGRFKDAYVYEGALRTRALVEILSGTLQVRLQAFNYVATIPHRYPTAFSLLDGTGLIFPAGY